MWTWRQKTGELLRDGHTISRGYSGHGEGKNNPALQHVRSTGPVPCGLWKITELIPKHGSHGPFVLRIMPEKGTNTFGRSGFLIHGDAIKAPGTASLGCIILARSIRELIWMSGDRLLEVVPGDSVDKSTPSVA